MATTAISKDTVSFAPMSARRMLILGGIVLIAGGMLFGDVFAVFVLHQNGGRTGEMLQAAAQAAADQDVAGVRNAFASIGGLLEDRGTKIDTHVHMSDAGYLALLLALVQPYVVLPSQRKKRLAKIFLTGAVMLPVGIFLIHYVGLAYSPFPVIGWASVLADTGGALLIVALLGEAWGVWKYLRGKRSELDSEPQNESSWSGRAMLSGGTALILLGFLYGAWFSAFDLYPQEKREVSIFSSLVDQAAANNSAGIADSVNDYGGLAAAHAASIAAHSHIIEFGLLALLLSFVQPYVFLSEKWKRRWVVVLLSGSIILPVFVLMEINFGLVPGAIADFGGLLVIIALMGMLTGVLRYTGRLDAGVTR
ncbi:MAG TPA: hypothetical protein VFI95_17480 [Terriglobales bacterium]|nr:hypothetical protein [Terriglobales bacterium]